MDSTTTTAGGSNNNNNNNNGAAAVRSSSSATTTGGSGGGGFKKGGFKSSFTAVKGTAPAAAATAPGVRKNVLGDDEDEDAEFGDKEKNSSAGQATAPGGAAHRAADVESDTDEDYGYQNDSDGAYYDPSKPTGCNTGCPSLVSA